MTQYTSGEKLSVSSTHGGRARVLAYTVFITSPGNRIEPAGALLAASYPGYELGAHAPWCYVPTHGLLMAWNCTVRAAEHYQPMRCMSAAPSVQAKLSILQVSMLQ